MRDDPWLMLKVGEETQEPRLDGETIADAKERLRMRALKFANREVGYFLVKGEDGRLFVRRMNNWPLDKLSEWTTLMVGQAIRLSQYPNEETLRMARQRKRYLETKRMGQFVLRYLDGELWVIRDR
jgi:hypothetical protein